MRTFPEVVALAANEAALQEAQRVEAILARVIAEAGEGCWQVRIGNTIYAKHPPARSVIEKLRARMRRCSCPGNEQA